MIVNQIVTLQKTGAVAKQGEAQHSPLIIAEQVHELDCDIAHLSEILSPVWVAGFKYYHLEPGPSVREALPELLEWCRSDEGLSSFLPGIERAQESADDSFIARELKWLTTSWPNASKADMAGFGAMLTVDVKCANPTRYGLASACMALRRTNRFMPAISEVLDAIRGADERVRSVHLALSTLPQILADLKAKADEEAEQRKKREAENEWRESIKAKAGHRCEQCGENALHTQFTVGWMAEDKSDARCLCPYCARHPMTEEQIARRMEKYGHVASW